MMETLGDRHTLFPSAPCRPAPSLLPSSAPSDYHCPGRAAFSLNLTLVSRSALLLCRARRARSAIGNSDSVRLFRPFFACSFPSVGSRASDAAISDGEPPRHQRRPLRWAPPCSRLLSCLVPLLAVTCSSGGSFLGPLSTSRVCHRHPFPRPRPHGSDRFIVDLSVLRAVPAVTPSTPVTQRTAAGLTAPRGSPSEDG